MALNAAPPSLADTPPSILCVDGNARMLEVITKILAGLPVKCVTTSDPNAALAQARQLHPRLLILDWQLPQMNGWELLNAIRAERQPSALRVIILSGCEGGFEKMLAKNVAGADAFLEKPVEADRLSREICRLLALPLPGSAPHA